MKILNVDKISIETKQNFLLAGLKSRKPGCFDIPVQVLFHQQPVQFKFISFDLNLGALSLFNFN